MSSGWDLEVSSEPEAAAPALRPSPRAGPSLDELGEWSKNCGTVAGPVLQATHFQASVSTRKRVEPKLAAQSLPALTSFMPEQLLVPKAQLCPFSDPTSVSELSSFTVKIKISSQPPCP